MANKKTIDGLHGTNITLSMEDKMAAGALGALRIMGEAAPLKFALTGISTLS